MKYVVGSIKIEQVEKGKINKIYIPKTSELDPSEFVLVDGKYAFKFEFTNGCNAQLSKIQREFLNKSVGKDEISVRHLNVVECDPISLLKLDMEIINLEKVDFDAKELVEKFKDIYVSFPFNIDQKFYLYVGDFGFKVVVREMFTALDKRYGILLRNTEVFINSISERLTLSNNTRENMLLDPNFNFESLGIGGLKQEFGKMFRRAFVQRAFDSDVIRKFGIPHVKGMILYGPPGTGKTLIARKLGSLLNARPPKIVNGPEILNKYVGQSEENIRNLFKDAEEEWKVKKEDSNLHIIIFDEIDAICRRRGNSNGTGVGDQVVNQLLSKMDGVESIENILVIGMTNRLDLIDEALLRPGRFEIHLEISLPDEESRIEIFRIHTKTMESHDYLDKSVDLNKVAKLSKNYTGAEITAVVKSAVSFALERKVHGERLDGEKMNVVGDKNIKVYMNDFIQALDEVKPSFGINELDFYRFEKTFYETPIFTQGIEHGKNLLQKLRKTNLYSTSSLLFYGSPGVGKTTLAVKAARSSMFPFIKIISPRDIIGLSEYEKVNYIKEKFMDAYKSEESIIILDDIEGLIDFVNIGPRFSNSVLQALKIFIKEESRKKMFVFGTTSSVEVARECGIYECFQSAYEVEKIGFPDYEILCKQNSSFSEIQYEEPMSIKQLLSLLDEPDISPQ
ncbi:Cdc48-like AAA ATPase [Encephalitozoon romaleae SJ-2008]|uniref:Vesicular-fusion protein SEC18 n=1 Tax=Encephalitozoon romaleae (strain SJ-2008) TaxID=1178016 RepID=I6ZT17_ENCRO|nr:Cdc48-like AAA ATPase [Encephalitozoon romaleae SJ-2008]AFN82751.1 Cdc48-like AAA ATPase [Encephalitozoon romaleae SJ-2008]